jgi:hypothetical protein
MHHQRRHVVVDDRHLDALDHQLLVHQLQMDRWSDMDRQMLNHPRHAVGNFQCPHLLDAVNLDVLQNLGELNLDADLTCQVVAHLSHQLVVQVGAELRHQLRMDYFPGAVGVELRHQLRMDCFLAAELVLLALELLQHQELPHRFQQQLVAQYCFQQSRALAQPLAQLNQRQVRQLIQQLILDLLRLFWQPSSLRQLS